MHSRLRSAWLWLLLLALPLQGFAAAAMVHCGPNHHRMQAAAAPASHAGHAGHRHATAGHLMHDAGAQAGTSVHDLDTLSKFKCSACAACCMGAGMPTMALFVAALPPATAQAAPSAAPHPEFLPDGLDRPPRPPLV